MVAARFDLSGDGGANLRETGENLLACRVESTVRRDLLLPLREPDGLRLRGLAL